MVNPSWALEPADIPDKFDLRVLLGERGEARDFVLPRVTLLHGRADDVVLERVTVRAFQAGAAELVAPRWIDCVVEGVDWCATRVVGGYFRATRFASPLWRSVVFERCVFDRAGFELPEVPAPELVRFEQCTFVDAPTAMLRRWRQARVLCDRTLLVDGERPVVPAPRNAPAASVAPAGAAAAAPTPPRAAEPTPVAPGRFSALER
jgi:hypothetical protein